MEKDIVVYFDLDIEKVKFTMKHLAARLAVSPISVHAYIRNGRDKAGQIVCKKAAKKLNEIKLYLQQCIQTFEAIRITGHFDFEEIAQEIGE